MTEPMKTAEGPTEEKLIELAISQTVGVKIGSDPLTPMDYGECKQCLKEFAAQQVAAERARIKVRLGKYIIEHEYELDSPGDPIINVSVLFELIDSL